MRNAQRQLVSLGLLHMVVGTDVVAVVRGEFDSPKMAPWLAPPYLVPSYVCKHVEVSATILCTQAKAHQQQQLC